MDRSHGRTIRTTGLLILVGLAAVGCSSGPATEVRVETSRAQFNTVSDLAKTADLVFSGRISSQGEIARAPEPAPEVKGDTSPQLFAYSLVNIQVDEVIVTREAAAGLPAILQAGAPTGFAIIDPSLRGVSNDRELKKEYRVVGEVPKSGAEGIFFAAYHTLGSAGDGFEIVGFAASSDKKNGRFEDGIQGDLAGLSKPYEEIVVTSKTELKNGRVAAE